MDGVLYILEGIVVEKLRDNIPVTVSQDLETHTLPFDTSGSIMMTYGLYYDHYIFSKRDW